MHDIGQGLLKDGQESFKKKLGFFLLCKLAEKVCLILLFESFRSSDIRFLLSKVGHFLHFLLFDREPILKGTKRS